MQQGKFIAHLDHKRTLRGGQAFGSSVRCGFSYGETNRGSEMKLTATVFADEHTARSDRICSPAR